MDPAERRCCANCTDHAAAHVRGERRRERLQDNPYLAAVEKRAVGRRGRRAGVRRDRVGDRPAQPDERLAFLEDSACTNPPRPRDPPAYHLLGLLDVPSRPARRKCGPGRPTRAPRPQAAGEIPHDFEKGFIRAEVISYEDFVACKGEQGAKEAGRMRLEGRNTSVARATSCTSGQL